MGGTGSSNVANSSSYCLRGFSAVAEMLVASGEKAQAMLASASEVADVWRVAVTGTVSLLCACAPTNPEAAVPHAAQNDFSSPPTSAPSSRDASSKHSTSPASPHLPDLAFDILTCEHTAVARTVQNDAIAVSHTVKDTVFTPPPSQLSYSSTASSLPRSSHLPPRQPVPHTEIEIHDDDPQAMIIEVYPTARLCPLRVNKTKVHMDPVALASARAAHETLATPNAHPHTQ